MQLTAMIKVMDLLYQEYLIPMVIFDEEDTPLYPKMNISTSLFNNQTDSKVTLFKKSDYLFATFNIKNINGPTYHFLLGPCGITGTTATTYKMRKEIFYSNIHYAKETVGNFISFLELIYPIMTGDILLQSDITWHDASVPNDPISDTTSFVQNLYERRVKGTTLDAYQMELHYIECIKKKQPEKIKYLLKKLAENREENLSTNEIESLKLKFAALTAILTRISIEQGVPINQAFSLSDTLIQGLASVHSFEAWIEHVQIATNSFIGIQEEATKISQSPLIKKIINHIDDHLYEKVTLDTLASVTNKNKAYLSTQFKKETGLTIHQYIQTKKIEEAKHLLLFTEQQLFEISALLSFASQSHFIKVFKQITGTTPKEYRSKHFNTI
ncbi:MULTISPECIES: AraC family transcriptional regulator [Pediococcus]|nr:MULTISPECIES: AraC family transcriptional regulator [Pediococcus]KAF5440211.1 helix-turn-helix transcriptional regulator [Pediococcus sp. EKM202D]KAF5440343.1 helix-turn-helix transcriptional regulator [Pediococcus sp. EKM201D]MCT1177469.1 AraC family transcriptional regulator [Pediococcus pentosaceus]NEZ69658.1 AraC family transcriptional regulator [Pediococcus pentosaceus]QHM65585.1 Bifunctional transcriptional activator/DNA repair enzyme AdaA [Pediococcus pentosaceus]